MTDLEDNINLGKVVSDDNNQQRKTWACLGQDKPLPDRWFCFCPNFCSFYWPSLVAFGELTFQKLVTNQLFGLDYCVVRQDTFYPHQDFEQVNFYEKSSLYIIGWSLRNWKIAVFLRLAKNWNISTKIWKKLLFYQHSQPLFDVMQKQIGNLEFFRGVNFELIDSLKNHVTK